MQILHMDTELTRTTGHEINRLFREVFESADGLAGAWHHLSHHWESKGRDHFEQKIGGVISGIKDLAEAGRDLGLCAQREADEWERTDRDGAKMFANLHERQLEQEPLFINQIGPEGVPWLVDVWNQIQRGIGAFFHTTTDALDRVGDLAAQGWDALIIASDAAALALLSTFLPRVFPGSEESLKFKVKGSITIPGIIVDTPISGKAQGEKTVEVTRLDDGKYRVTVRIEGGLGIEADLIEAEGSIRVGRKKIATGVDVGADALVVGGGEVSFDFDPNVQGDMTKMSALIGSLGTTPAFTGGDVLVGPSLYALKDHVSDVRTQAGIGGGAEGDASALYSLIGAKAEGSLTGGAQLAKNEFGQWEQSNLVELAGEARVHQLAMAQGFDGQVTLEQVKNLDTGQEQARVTLEVSVPEGGHLEVKDLEKYLPRNARRGLDDLNVGVIAEQYDKVTIQYTLNSPVEHVRDVLIPGDSQADFAAWAEDSSVVIKKATGTELGLGAEGEFGAVTQSIGLGGEITGTRESEVTILTYP